MDTAKIAIFSSANTPFQLKEIKVPSLKPDEVLIKNEFTSLCRSDLNTFCGKRTEKTPTILGHEVVGRVVDLGTDKNKVDLNGNLLKPQDRITWGIYASDPNSDLAKAGIPQKSPDLFKYGHEQITQDSNFHGGLSEYTILRPNTPVVKIAEDIPLKVASIINCSVATIAGALRLAGGISHKKVLISGAGMLGLVGCAMSKAKGASKITVSDINPQRMQKAKGFGADSSILAEDLKKSENNLFDIILELSGVTSAMEDTLPLLQIGGCAIWVGATHPQPLVKLNAEQIVRNLWTIKGLHNYNADDLKSAVNFMEQNHFNYPFGELIVDQFKLENVNEAFTYALDENPFRVGIQF